MKKIPDPNLPPVELTVKQRVDAAGEKNFNVYTECSEKISRSAEEEVPVRIWCQFVKFMPECPRVNLPEQCENITGEDLHVFARKQLSFHNLCKGNDQLMIVFSQM